MTIIRCKECNQSISDKAEKCPNCGAPTSTKAGCLSSILIGFFVFMIIGYAVQFSAPPTPPKTEEQIRRETIEEHFSPWAGEHNGLTQLVKKSLNDPESYDHDKTTYIDNGDHLIVTTTFRARNQYGGMSTHEIKAMTDLSGNVIKVLSHKQPDKL